MQCYANLCCATPWYTILCYACRYVYMCVCTPTCNHENNGNDYDSNQAMLDMRQVKCALAFRCRCVPHRDWCCSHFGSSAQL